MRTMAGAVLVSTLVLSMGGARALSRAASSTKRALPSFAMCFETRHHLLGLPRSHSLSSSTRLLRKHPHGTVPSRGNAFSTCVSAASSSSKGAADASGNGPIPKEEVVEYQYHGYTRKDEYAWMKDDNWQQVLREPSILRADIRAHLEEENRYVDAVLAPTKDIQATLVKEMKGRMAQDDSSVPLPDGPFAYYSRYVEGGEYPIRSRMARKDFESGKWTADGPAPASQEDLIDGNELGKGQEFFKLGAIEHSPDHKRVAYSTDLKGSEYFTIRFKDLSTGNMLGDELVNCSSSFVWCKDSNTVVYTVIDDNHREKWVYRHHLGDPQSSDELLYMEPDDGMFLGVSLTDTGNWITIQSSDHDTTEVRIVSASGDVSAKPILVEPREVGVRYEVSDWDDQLVILTNDPTGSARDFRVVTAPIASPAKANWKEVVPHKAGVLIRGIQTVKGHLVRSERVSALPRLVVSSIVKKDGGLSLEDEHVIEFEEEAYGLRAQGSLEHDTTTVRIGYSSPCTPESVFDYDILKRERTTRKVQKVPSGHNPNDYVCRRLHAIAHDGVKIPLTVLHHKDTPIDGSAPLLLYGYGSYGISMPAEFSTNRLSMADRGIVYAIGHVRGGTDCGYAWYDPDGKRMKKKNTFQDFIACAEFLVEHKYTSEGNIAIQGGSAGGLLVGASMNLAREGLFKAVVGEVPFVDVLNTMCDTTLPLTPPEWPEWGNPIESREEYDYIESYSPYDQITSRKYPHVLATGGLTDPRVTYWEPAKWIAKLRKLRTDDGMSLCKINMGAGHAGKSGRFDRLEEVALVYAFVLMVFGKL